MERLPWELLSKYFKKTITYPEQSVLDDWIKESRENFLLFEEIAKLVKDDQFFPGNFEENTTQAWDKIISRLSQKKTIRIKANKFYRIAAAITVLLLLAGSLTGYFYKSYITGKQLANSYTTVYSHGGQKTEITLPDHTKVWLNANTSLRYPSNFEGRDRDVYLEGEAYFDVEHNDAKPFIVNTSEIKIKVLGTTFNVKAYQNEDVIEATLVKGKITILGIKDQDSKEIVLAPNETFTFHKPQAVAELNNAKEKNGKAEKLRTEKSVPHVDIQEKVNVDPIVAWKDGKLVFEDETFGSLAVKLERWYNVKIHFEDPEIMNIRYSGTFEKENINQVMNYIKTTTPIEYSIKLNEITIQSDMRRTLKKEGQ